MVTLLVALALCPDAHAARLGGVVYEDLDADGVRDEGEPGLPGILVSNQDEVVATDAQGRWSLPADDDTTVFVTKPAGFETALSEHGLPRFYYQHKPKGSPKSFEGGVAPTGKPPKSVDFGLRRVDEPDRFRLVALADTQPETVGELVYIAEDIAPHLARLEAQRVVVLGDLLFDHLRWFGLYVEVFGMVGLPIHNVIGNHDLNFDAEDDRTSDETFERWFGPSYYSFDQGKVHFMVLDTVLWQGPGGTGNYLGGLDERQLGWIENDLAHVPPDKLVVPMMHIPLLTARQDAEPIEGFDRVIAVLEGRKVLALAGHQHETAHVFLGEGYGRSGEPIHEIIGTTVCGAWWSGDKDYRGIPYAHQYDGVPNGWTVVDFEGTDYVATFQAARGDRDEQIRIYVPEEMGRDVVLANVFFGHGGWTVTMSVDGGEPMPMVQVPGKDPLAQDLYEGPSDVGKPWVDAVWTPHLWEAPVPDVPEGLRRLEVTATDENGQSWTATRMLVK